ncbi:MAG: YggT family protein [Halanaerobiales bacterium]|nr:YggT family protein [Halanaerobiales bacterium]
MSLLIWLVSTVFTVINWLILFRVIISWIRPDVDNPQWRKLLSIVYKITEPILGPIRRIIPTGKIGIDFSPIIAFFALSIIRNFVINLLRSFMYGV